MTVPVNGSLDTGFKQGNLLSGDFGAKPEMRLSIYVWRQRSGMLFRLALPVKSPTMQEPQVPFKLAVQV